MTDLNFIQPIVFEPLFIERIWGGRRLETQFGKQLPTGMCIGESWEMVDRPEAQILCAMARYAARRCMNSGRKIDRRFLEMVPDTPRFPLLAN